MRKSDDPQPGARGETGASGPEVTAAESLEGDRVVNSLGEDLGTIEDIMIDVPRGTVAYAVISRGRFLGIGDRLFAIPWSALTQDAGRRCFVLDADRDRMESAPAFDKHYWPSMADPRWAAEVHAFYNVPPYWIADSAGGAGASGPAGP
jgi:sporulation protein YlmC with PRC-barrel domain